MPAPKPTATPARKRVASPEIAAVPAKASVEAAPKDGASKPVAPKPVKAVTPSPVTPVAVKAVEKTAAEMPKAVEKTAVAMTKAIEKTAAETPKIAEKIIEAPVAIMKAVISEVSSEPVKPTLVPKPVSVEAPVPLNSPAASIPSKPFKLMVNSMATAPSMPFKGYDDFAAFSKANFEAMIQANQILAKGFEEISKEMVSLTQSSMESAASAAKAMLAAKSLKEAVELNADYTKSSFEKFVANSTKLSELGVKVATDAFAPVTARVHSAVEKVVKPVHAA